MKNYEIHGYTVRMTAEQASIWNAGEATAANMAGATVSVPTRQNVAEEYDLGLVISYAANPVEGDLMETEIDRNIDGYPANPIR